MYTRGFVLKNILADLFILKYLLFSLIGLKKKLYIYIYIYNLTLLREKMLNVTTDEQVYNPDE